MVGVTRKGLRKGIITKAKRRKSHRKVGDSESAVETAEGTKRIKTDI